MEKSLGEIEGKQITMKDVNDAITKQGFVCMHSLVSMRSVNQSKEGSEVEEVDEYQCPITHTVGMGDSKLPEIVIIGLQPENAEMAVMWVKDWISKEMVLNELYFLNAPNNRMMALVEADKSNVVFGTLSDALDSYWEDREAKGLTIEKRVMQLVFSDENGLFVWQPGSNDELKKVPYMGVHASEFQTKSEDKNRRAMCSRFFSFKINLHS